MRKTLLLSVVLLCCIFGAKAQNYEWVVGNDAVNFPVISGQTSETTIQGLTITPGTSKVVNMGQIEASEKPFGEIVYPNRFKFNGGGYSGASDADAVPTANMPTQRYISFMAPGKCEILVHGITGSSTSARKIFVTDGTTLIGTFSFAKGLNLEELKMDYNGSAARLYMFCNASVNLTYIKVTSDTGGSTSLNEVSATTGEVLSIAYFDVLGKQANESTKGLIIKKSTFSDGSVQTEKMYVK